MAMARLLEISQVLRPDRGGEDWFEPEQFLGKRGHKYFSLGTKYWLSACAGLKIIDEDGSSRRGIVVGANYGAHVTLRQIEQTILSEGASSLSPTFAPNFCVNLITGQAAVRYAARGFNLLITTPKTAGLDAFILGARELARRRVDLVLAGSAEERETCGTHLDGALAIALGPVEDAVSRGLGLVALCHEAHVPDLGVWRDAASAAVATGFVGARQAILAADDARRTVLLADDGELLGNVGSVLLATGHPVEALCSLLLSNRHGALEPLRALASACATGAPLRFVYASTNGAFRLIDVDPVP